MGEGACEVTERTERWLDAFVEGLRGRSTARLQEMRRLLDEELARRRQPAPDLRDQDAHIRREIHALSDFVERAR